MLMVSRRDGCASDPPGRESQLRGLNLGTSSPPRSTDPFTTNQSEGVIGLNMTLSYPNHKTNANIDRTHSLVTSSQSYIAHTPRNEATLLESFCVSQPGCSEVDSRYST